MSRGMRQFYGSERAARSCRDLPWCLQLLCLAECVSSACRCLANASVGMVRKKVLVPAETCPCVCMYGVSRNVSVCMARKGLLVPAEICPGICMYGVSRIVSLGKARKGCSFLPRSALMSEVTATLGMRLSECVRTWLGKDCSFLPRPVLVSAVTVSRGMRQLV